MPKTFNHTKKYTNRQTDRQTYCNTELSTVLCRQLLHPPPPSCAQQRIRDPKQRISLNRRLDLLSAAAADARVGLLLTTNDWSDVSDHQARVCVRQPGDANTSLVAAVWLIPLGVRSCRFRCCCCRRCCCCSWCSVPQRNSTSVSGGRFAGVVM